MDTNNPEHIGLFNRLMSIAIRNMRTDVIPYYSDIVHDVTMIAECLPEPKASVRFFWLITDVGTHLVREDHEDVDETMTNWAKTLPTRPLFTITLRRGNSVLFTDVDKVEAWAQ